MIMRGFGDFQRAQMRRQVDPRISEVFKHIRQTVDALEQLILSSVPRQTTEDGKPAISEKPSPRVSVAPDSVKLAYTIKEVRKLVGIGHTKLYEAIGANELRAVKHGKRTFILARDLQVWLDNFPPIKES
jgi:excisionase family DNA binding protein